MKRLDNMEKEYGEVIQKLEELNEKDESNPVPSMDAFRTMVRDVKEKKAKKHPPFQYSVCLCGGIVLIRRLYRFVYFAGVFHYYTMLSGHSFAFCDHQIQKGGCAA